MRDTDPIKSRWECLRIVMVWYKLLIFGGDTDIYPTYRPMGLMGIIGMMRMMDGRVDVGV